MHTVIVDGDVSYPPTSGKRLRTLNLMLRLARRHRLTYIGRCDSPADETRRAREFLSDHGIEPILVNHPLPRKRGLAFYARLALNQLSPLPYSVASHQSAAMARAIRDYAAGHRVDLWQFEWVAYLTNLPPSARTVAVQHNVETVIWQRYYEAETNRLRRWMIGQQRRKFERFERQALARVDSVVAVSPDDAERMRRWFGLGDVAVVENGIDQAYYRAVSGRRDPHIILFLGALDWRPNLDAVGLLLDRIFPAVRARVPSARLWLVGRRPPAALCRRAASEPNVELHADVPDVRPYMGDAGVLAVPLRIGGGSRLKILEALACGLPVVSTRVGAEGLTLRPGVDYVAAEEEEMAEALVQAVQHPAPHREMASRAQPFVCEHYDWDALADKLEMVWEQCVRSGRVPVEAPGC